jgi:hypothetical protein
VSKTESVIFSSPMTPPLLKVRFQGKVGKGDFERVRICLPSYDEQVLIHSLWRSPEKNQDRAIDRSPTSRPIAGLDARLADGPCAGARGRVSYDQGLISGIMCVLVFQ